MCAGRAERVGLVATNSSIRGGANRRVLAPIAAESKIFEAWSDEPWIIDGAAVRVSLVCFGRDEAKKLNGKNVLEINSDLTATGLNFTQARQLTENAGVAFQGPVLVGEFDVTPNDARHWLKEPLNPNGRPNSDVLRPLRNGKDINSRPRDYWVIDFSDFDEASAALYAAPFQYILKNVKPVREHNARLRRRILWWRHGDVAPKMWAAIRQTSRYIACSQVSKHRMFVWLDPVVWPHQTVIAIARDDDTTFGTLHSRFHEAWSLRLGTSLEDRPRYTPTTTFETFPFPEGLTPDIPAADYAADPRAIRIAAAAKRLDDLRRAWLNPPDLIRIEPEVVPGYPDRVLPKDQAAAAILAKRTLTNLYNERPQWLANAHEALDGAVAAAYGWAEDIPTEEALEKLLALNLVRAETVA
jgi:type II restriction/modification system DNA methylase subunit YeeA